jgi:hypothetical protein
MVYLTVSYQQYRKFDANIINAYMNAFKCALYILVIKIKPVKGEHFFFSCADAYLFIGCDLFNCIIQHLIRTMNVFCCRVFINIHKLKVLV